MLPHNLQKQLKRYYYFCLKKSANQRQELEILTNKTAGNCSVQAACRLSVQMSKTVASVGRGEMRADVLLHSQANYICNCTNSAPASIGIMIQTPAQAGDPNDIWLELKSLQ